MATVRNDLAILPYSDPEMVFPKVAPVLTKYAPSGTEYYTPWNQDVTAQTGRNPLGDITAHAVGAASANYNCAEIIDRENMSYDAIKASYRDDLRAEMSMARIGKRAVSDKLELQLKSALLSSPEDIHSETDICGAVQRARHHPGCGETEVSLFTAWWKTTRDVNRWFPASLEHGEGPHPRGTALSQTLSQLAAMMGKHRNSSAPNSLGVVKKKKQNKKHARKVTGWDN